jgi:hypothetical protein
MQNDTTTSLDEGTGSPRRKLRPMTTAAIVLAALAVVALVMWSTFRGGGEPVPGAASTSPPRTSPTSTTTTTASASPSTPITAPTGDADAPSRTVTVNPAVAVVERPGLPYLLDKTLHHGLATVSYAVSNRFGLIPLEGGRALLMENTRETDWDTAKVTDAAGTVVAKVTVAAGRHLSAATDAAGARFALLDASLDGQGTSGLLTLHDSQGRKILTKSDVRDQLYPVGFVGGGVLLSDHEGEGTYVWDLTRNTLARYTATGVAVSVSERSGRAAFVEPADYDQPRCTTVADVRGSVPITVSRTCGLFYPSELSADGRYLLGIKVPSDGMLQSASRVIDVSTGKPVIVFDEPTPMDSDARFLSDGSVGLNLMVSAHGAWTNTLVRCTLSGECTRMVETVPVPGYDDHLLTRYHLVVDPLD